MGRASRDTRSGAPARGSLRQPGDRGHIDPPSWDRPVPRGCRRPRLRSEQARGGSVPDEAQRWAALDTGKLDGWSLRLPCFGNWDDTAIPDPGAAESKIVLAWINGNAPTRTHVHVEIDHTWRGDLKLDLIAPDGKVYALRAADAKDGTDNINESYWVNASASPSNGTWKLRAEDLAKGDKGFINGWTLTL